jgi:hypothetical protein
VEKRCFPAKIACEMARKRYLVWPVKIRLIQTSWPKRRDKVRAVAGIVFCRTSSDQHCTEYCGFWVGDARITSHGGFGGSSIMLCDFGSTSNSFELCFHGSSLGLIVPCKTKNSTWQSGKFLAYQSNCSGISLSLENHRLFAQ